MPTTRHRHAVTETDEIAEILDKAARKWPKANRAKLIYLVMAEWASAEQSPEDRAIARKLLIASLPGSAELYDRAQDWPE